MAYNGGLRTSVLNNKPGTVTTNNLTFTGREDDGTELLYYRSRYYSPEMQRFISEDPIGFNSGDTNLYRYGSNTPHVTTDPMGTEDTKFCTSECGTGNNSGSIFTDIFNAVSFIVNFFGSLFSGGGDPPPPTAPIMANALGLRNVGYQLAQLPTSADTFHGDGSSYGPGVNDYRQPFEPSQNMLNTRRTDKEKATDVPSWSRQYTRNPNESCKQFASRILIEHYGAEDSRAFKRGPGTEYSKILKNCERGGR